jgi:hypothetical protein
MDYGSRQLRKTGSSHQQSGLTSTKNETVSRSIAESQMGEREENLKVIVRCRPLMQREALNGIFVSTADVCPDQRSINLYEYFNLELVDPARIEEYIEDPDSYQTHTFTFDRVYDETATQEEIYETTAQEAVFSALEVSTYSNDRAIMPLFWHMVKLAQERHIPWKASNTMAMIPREASYPGQLKTSLTTFERKVIQRAHSWSDAVTFKFTMRLFLIC